MAFTNIVVEETDDAYATWSHVFQGKNTTWTGLVPLLTRQIQGNFFIGLQGQTVNMWDAQIPAGANIDSATMEVTAFQNSLVGTHTPRMNSPKRSTDDYLLLPFQKPFDAFEGWRRDRWSNQEVALLNTGLSIIANPLGVDVGNAKWILRQLVRPGATLPTRDKMGQKVTILANANLVLRFGIYQLQRTGNPTGDITIRLQGITTDHGVEIPDGIDVAVSDPRLASDVPTGALTAMFFNFPTQPTLVEGQDYFMVIEVEYTANNTDYIEASHKNTFLSDGQLFHFGQGVGNDWQNAPGAVEADQWHNSTVIENVGADILWPMPQFIANVTYTSPDISALIQSIVNDPGYEPDAGIIIGINRTTTDTTRNRIWSSNLHATNPGPVLRVSFGNRRIGIT